MSLEKINLRKLLQFFVADARKQRSLLLADIRNERAKETRDSNDGGDFYTPFWSDVKDHAARRSDIVEQTKVRISKNKARARLYPLLRDSFSEMWNEKMRWRNEPYEFAPQSIKAQLQLRELRALIKIEKGVFVTTSSFSQQAIDFAKHLSQRVILIDGARLTELMIEHNVGVRLSRALEFKRIDEDFFAEDDA